MVSDDDYQERIAALEETVSELRDTVQSFQEEGARADVSRRSVLGATGALGAAGLVGIGAAGTATAQGSVGSADHRVDLFADTVDVAGVQIGELETHPNRRVAITDDETDTEFFHLDPEDESIVWADADTWMRGNDLNDVGAIDHSDLTGGERIENLVGDNLFVDSGGTLNAAGGDGSGGDDSVYRPAPGDVHAALANARDDGGGVVRLHSGEVYDPDETWQIWSDVTLEYNGARTELTSDIDLHRFWPGGRVVDQDVDVRGVGGYSSAVNLVYNDDENNSWAWGVGGTSTQPHAPTTWNVQGGRIRGAREDGTAIDVVNPGNAKAIHFFYATCFVRSMETGIRLFRQAGGTQINGLMFNVRFMNHGTAVHQEYDPNQPDALDYSLNNHHLFNLSLTGHGGGEDGSDEPELVWHLEEGRGCRMRMHPYNIDWNRHQDTSGDGEPDVWRIEENFEHEPWWRQNTLNSVWTNTEPNAGFIIDEKTEHADRNGIVNYQDLRTPLTEL